LPEALKCRYCDRDVAADFAFCPYCGTQLWTDKDSFTFNASLWSLISVCLMGLEILNE
jgi:hypothetical protein